MIAKLKTISLKSLKVKFGHSSRKYEDEKSKWKEIIKWIKNKSLEVKILNF